MKKDLFIRTETGGVYDFKIVRETKINAALYAYFVAQLN